MSYDCTGDLLRSGGSLPSSLMCWTLRKVLCSARIECVKVFSCERESVRECVREECVLRRSKMIVTVCVVTCDVARVRRYPYAELA